MRRAVTPPLSFPSLSGNEEGSLDEEESWVTPCHPVGTVHSGFQLVLSRAGSVCLPASGAQWSKP